MRLIEFFEADFDCDFTVSWTVINRITEQIEQNAVIDSKVCADL